MPTVNSTLILTAFVVFCRVGGCLFIVPGFSSPRIPVRPRLFVAIAVSLALTPVLEIAVRPIVAAATPMTLVGIIVAESLKGVLIGLLARFFFIALETMTMAISMSIGLTSVMGPPVEEDEAMPSIVTMITLVAMLLIFISDLHWEVFRGLAASYDVLPVGQGFDPRVGIVQLADGATRTFLFAVKIASPFLVFSVVINFAIGLVNKLVPQIPVSFISAPFLLAGGLFILYFSLRPSLDLFMSAFAAWLRSGG